MTNVVLKPVTRDDVIPLIDIRVAMDQRDFVSPNEKSLAQAAYEPGAYPFVIWVGNLRVGFIQMIDLIENEFREAYEDPNAAHLWRFLIGSKHQGQGYGRASMMAAIEWARGRGKSSITLTVVPENALAVKFYKSIGFTATGRSPSGEDEYVLGL